MLKNTQPIVTTLFLASLFSKSLFAAPAPIIASTIDTDSLNKLPGIGYTLSTAKRPFIGVDNQKTSLPYFSFQYKKFYIESLDVGYNIAQDNGINLSILATPRFYERKASFADNGELDGINKTSETYLAGFSSQIHTDYGVITLQILNDVIESNGFEAVAQISKTYDVNKVFKFTPSFGITIQDKKLVDHFYGVDETETVTGRLAYNGDTAVNYNITLNTSWELNKHIELLGQFRYEWLGDGITDSSIVDEDIVYFLTGGIVFRY